MPTDDPHGSTSVVHVHVHSCNQITLTCTSLQAMLTLGLLVSFVAHAWVYRWNLASADGQTMLEVNVC
jgi:hypothetical protein